MWDPTLVKATKQIQPVDVLWVTVWLLKFLLQTRQKPLRHTVVSPTNEPCAKQQLQQQQQLQTR